MRPPEWSKNHLRSRGSSVEEVSTDFEGNVQVTNPDSSSQSVYFVDRIIAQRWNSGRREMLVAWRGFPDKTWEPRANLVEDVPDAVAEFDAVARDRRALRRNRR